MTDWRADCFPDQGWRGRVVPSSRLVGSPGSGCFLFRIFIEVGFSFAKRLGFPPVEHRKKAKFGPLMRLAF